MQQFWKSPFNVFDLIVTVFCALTLLVLAFAGCGATSKEEEMLDTLLLVARNVLQFGRLASVMRQYAPLYYSPLNHFPNPSELTGPDKVYSLDQDRSISPLSEEQGTAVLTWILKTRKTRAKILTSPEHTPGTLFYLTHETETSLKDHQLKMYYFGIHHGHKPSAIEIRGMYVPALYELQILLCAVNYHIYADSCTVWINGPVQYFISSRSSFTSTIWL